jgi:hypothetical protein
LHNLKSKPLACFCPAHTHHFCLTAGLPLPLSLPLLLPLPLSPPLLLLLLLLPLSPPPPLLLLLLLLLPSLYTHTSPHTHNRLCDFSSTRRAAAWPVSGTRLTRTSG